MTRALEDLTALLGAEVRELRRLLALGEEQVQVLLRGDAATLAGLTARQEALARRLGRLEDQRRSLVAPLAGALGLEPATLTLSTILGLVPEPPPALVALRRELRDLLARLLRVNERNGFLVERSLAHLERLLHHLLAALAPGATPTYAADGRTGRTRTALQLVDHRA
jgi:flagellar biosynthesis/type III secretory pathway chaperone